MWIDSTDWPYKLIDIILLYFRLVTRLENAYIYFDALKTLPEPSEDEITSYTLPDNPSLLPNTNSHVWGRMLAMGSCAVKVPMMG